MGCSLYIKPNTERKHHFTILHNHIMMMMIISLMKGGNVLFNIVFMVIWH